MQQPTNPMKKETYHDRCLFEVPVLNEDGTEKDSDYWLFCLKNKPCPIHSSMQKEETENEIKIKNFHCSEHGDIKPIATPECPKCISMQKEEWGGRV